MERISNACWAMLPIFSEQDLTAQQLDQITHALCKQDSCCRKVGSFWENGTRTHD